MTPEDFGIQVAKTINGSAEFKRLVGDLGGVICDELIRNVATKLRVQAELSLGIKFEDEEKHYDFAMSFEGDSCRNIQKELAKYILEY